MNPPVLSGEKPGPHKIQRISAGFIPNTLDTNAYDGVRRVSSEEAFELARAIGGAGRILESVSQAQLLSMLLLKSQKNWVAVKVLALAPDNGERYLSDYPLQFE